MSHQNRQNTDLDTGSEQKKSGAPALRSRLFLAAPLALGAIMAACGKSEFSAKGELRVRKTKDGAPEVDQLGGANGAGATNNGEAGGGSVTTTSQGAQGPALQNLPGTTILVDSTFTPDSGLINKSAVYGNNKSSFIALDVKGNVVGGSVAPGDQIIIAKPSPTDANCLKIIAIKTIQNGDVGKPLLFDIFNISNGSTLEVIQINSSKKIRSSITVSRTTTYKGKSVIDSPSLSSSPHSNYGTMMPTMRFVPAGDKEVSGTKQRGGTRGLLVAEMSTSWTSSLEDHVGLTHEVCNAFGEQLSFPLEATSLHKNNVFIIYNILQTLW